MLTLLTPVLAKVVALQVDEMLEAKTTPLEEEEEGVTE